MARRAILGVSIDVIDQIGAVERIVTWCRNATKHFVVTPNLDHVRQYHENAAFRRAYAGAGLVLADGRPLIWLSRLGGTPLHLVTGSDLIVPLCRRAAVEGLSVFLFGSHPQVLQKASAKLVSLIPDLRIAGRYSPPQGFEPKGDQLLDSIEIINAARPDIVLVALGAPKQELWAAAALPLLQAKSVICIGAGLDFLAGTVRRAPLPVRKAGLDWLWRACSEPRRLGRRYMVLVGILPVLLWRYGRVAQAPGSSTIRQPTT